MRILLIQPSLNWGKLIPETSSRALLTLGTLAKQRGHDVRIAHADLVDVSSELATFKPEIVGVTVNTFQVKSARAIAREAKAVGAKVIVGGPHACVWDGEADRVVTGEGENAFLEYIGEAPLINTNGDIPIPDYSLVDLDQFCGISPVGLMPSSAIMASRGCPFQCSFCLDGRTKVLTANFEWKNISEIKVGDKVIGIDEHSYYQETEVLKTYKRERVQTYRIETENGEVYATEEHPWLTVHNRWRKTNQLKPSWSLRKVADPQEDLSESDDYKKGYLSGVALGDGCFQYVTPHKLRQYLHFRLVGDTEMMDNFLRISNQIGLASHRGNFNSGKNSPFKNCDTAIYITENGEAEKLLAWTKKDGGSREYKRGFLAGIYDAEGSYSDVLRISGKDRDLLARGRDYLNEFGFSSIKEKTGLRLLGGLPEIIKFFSLVKPYVKHKRGKLIGHRLVNQTKIKRVAPAGIVDVYNLETTTHNFTANGFVTHNCNTPVFWGKQVRYRNPQSVVDEVELLHKQYGINEIFFQDDTFNLNHKWANAIFNGIIERGLNKEMLFKLDFRVNENLVTKELLDLAYKAGVWNIFYGIESGSQAMLDRMKKGITVAEIKRAVRMTHEAKIQTQCSFIVGMPGETMATLKETNELIKEISPTKYGWAHACPFPNTEFEREVTARGHKRIMDYAEYGYGKVICRTDTLTYEELEAFRGFN